MAGGVKRDGYNSARAKLVPALQGLVCSDDEAVKEAAVNATRNLGLVGHVALRLMDNIEEQHQIASVATQFQVLQAINLAQWNGVADMQISNRLLALLPKLAAMDFELAASGGTSNAIGNSGGAGGGSQLDAAAALMDTLPDDCYTVTFLEELEAMLQIVLAEEEATIAVAAEDNSVAASSTNNSSSGANGGAGRAGTSAEAGSNSTDNSLEAALIKSPAEALSVMLISLLTAKYADEIKENFQPFKLNDSPQSGSSVIVSSESGEEASKLRAEVVAATAAAEEEEDEAQEIAYGAVFSTVQDCLVHTRLNTRLEACHFIKTVTSGRPDSVYPKVITHQLTTRLTSEYDQEVRCALTVAIALCFEPSTLLDSLIKQLEESQSERCRQVAVVCLYSTISDQQLLPKEGSNPFRTLDASLKLYLAETFADLMLEHSKTPTVAMFTNWSESAVAKAAAFDLLRLSRSFEHEAVCNACICISSLEPDVASRSATAYLTTALTLGNAKHVQDAARNIGAAAASSFSLLASPSKSLSATTTKPTSATAAAAAGKALAWITPAKKSIESLLADPDAEIESKLLVLNTVLELEEEMGGGTSVDSDAVVSAAVCCLLDPAAKVRQRAAAVLSRIVPQWRTETTTAAAETDDAESAQARINEKTLQWLVNDIENRRLVVAAIGDVQCADAVVVRVMVALLGNSDIELRVATLNALTTLGVSSSAAVSKARLYLHASNPALRTAATTFVFSAVSSAAQRGGNLGGLSDDAEITNHALWCLMESDDGEVRHKAINMLRDVTLLQLEKQAGPGAGGGSGGLGAHSDGAIASTAFHNFDRFKLKDTLQNYVQQKSGKDTVEVQKLAWDFITGCFAFEPEDLTFMYACLDDAKAHSKVNSGSSNCCDLQVVSDVMQQIVLRASDSSITHPLHFFWVNSRTLMGIRGTPSVPPWVR